MRGLISLVLLTQLFQPWLRGQSKHSPEFYQSGFFRFCSSAHSTSPGNKATHLEWPKKVKKICALVHERYTETFLFQPLKWVWRKSFHIIIKFAKPFYMTTCQQMMCYYASRVSFLWLFLGDIHVETGQVYLCYSCFPGCAAGDAVTHILATT